MARRLVTWTAVVVAFAAIATLLLQWDRRQQVELAARVASADAVAAAAGTDPMIRQLMRVRATVEQCLAAILTTRTRTFEVIAAARKQERQRVVAQRAARRQAARRRAAQPRESGGLVVGDSVSLGAESCLQPLGYEVDSEVGRQFSVGLERLRAHAADGLPDSVVVHLGTNGPFGSEGFDEVMALTGSRRRVVWVTIALPDRSQYAFRNSLNDMIRSKARAYPNARVADWAAAVAQHPEWMYGDGIHINSAGCAGFTSVVDAAVRAPESG